MGWSARRNAGIPRLARRRQLSGRRRGDPGRRRDPKAAWSFYSKVHGASRLFGRKDAERQLWRAEMNAWIRCREVMLIGADFDESPMAYRRLPDVLPAHAGAVKILYTLPPVIVVVAGAGEKGSKCAAAK